MNGSSRGLGFGVLAALVVAALAGSATAEDPKPLRVGDPVPRFSFIDIEEEETSIAAYDGKVLVLSFGDRDSSEEMKEWMGDAQLTVLKTHPEIPTAYLAFADVSSVPSWLRGMVRPLLSSSNESAVEDLAEAQRDAGIEPDPTRTAFRFTADWDGSHLATFGLADATKYQCWIAVDGRVVAAMNPSTPDPAKIYIDAFEAIAKARESPPTTP
jgi:hypothetical protein